MTQTHRCHHAMTKSWHTQDAGESCFEHILVCTISMAEATGSGRGVTPLSSSTQQAGLLVQHRTHHTCGEGPHEGY